MRVTYITAMVIALLLVGWLYSGQLGSSGVEEHPTLAEQKRTMAAQYQDQAPTRVRGRVIQATPQTQHVVLRGKTENKRTVQVRAEIAGRIVDRPVELGTRVVKGDLLCQLSLEDRHVGLIEAREALNQARIEHQGSLKLERQGFLSETAIAQVKAHLASAQANLKRRELDVQRIYVRAPFAGIVEEVNQEIGDYVTPGAACVTVVDLDPMLMVGRVAEKDVHLIKLEQSVTGVLNDGRVVIGPVTFIGQQSDAATRSYAVTVQVPNADYNMRSGITIEMRIPVAVVMAQKVSSALFALDDAGNMGIRTVDEENHVTFNLVKIIREDSSGVWVSGLPEVATLITVGQELVVPGQEVEVMYESADPILDVAPANPPSIPADEVQQTVTPNDIAKVSSLVDTT